MTENIYDRATWPAPGSNPLVLLAEREDEWYSNKEIVAALGGAQSKSLIGQWPSLLDQIGEENTAIVERGLLQVGVERQPRGGGQERVFSKKALVLIAMRAQTPNAAAFRDWLASDFAIEARLDRL